MVNKVATDCANEENATEDLCLTSTDDNTWRHYHRKRRSSAKNECLLISSRPTSYTFHPKPDDLRVLSAGHVAGPSLLK